MPPANLRKLSVLVLSLSSAIGSGYVVARLSTPRGSKPRALPPPGYACVWHDEFGGELGHGQPRAKVDEASWTFQELDVTLLEDIIAPDCVMESVQPAPDGTRYEGYDASFSSWKALIDDTTSHFEVEDVHTGDEWAVIRWRYVWGPGSDDSVRGVNVMRVVDGRIVEAAGYSKTAPMVAALES